MTTRKRRADTFVVGFQGRRLHSQQPNFFSCESREEHQPETDQALADAVSLEDTLRKASEIESWLLQGGECDADASAEVALQSDSLSRFTLQAWGYLP